MGAHFRPRQRRAGAAGKRRAEWADECKARPTLISVASAGLLTTTTLSPEQQELAQLIDTESVRLRELLQVPLVPSEDKVGVWAPV